MKCFFVGGPLDGELRDVSPDYIVEGEWLTNPEYHISNGIARHESVSEEEVARRAGEWRDFHLRWSDFPFPNRAIPGESG